MNRIRPIHSLASVIGPCGLSPSVLAIERLRFSTACCFLWSWIKRAVDQHGVVASAGWKTRIVTLDQSTWQTCRRRDADPGDHVVARRGRAAVMNDPARSRSSEIAAFNQGNRFPNTRPVC